MQAHAKPRILRAGPGQTRVTTQTQSYGSQIIIFLDMYIGRPISN